MLNGFLVNNLVICTRLFALGYQVRAAARSKLIIQIIKEATSKFFIQVLPPDFLYFVAGGLG